MGLTIHGLWMICRLLTYTSSDGPQELWVDPVHGSDTVNNGSSPEDALKTMYAAVTELRKLRRETVQNYVVSCRFMSIISSILVPTCLSLVVPNCASFIL